MIQSSAQLLDLMRTCHAAALLPAERPGRCVALQSASQWPHAAQHPAHGCCVMPYGSCLQGVCLRHSGRGNRLSRVV